MALLFLLSPGHCLPAIGLPCQVGQKNLGPGFQARSQVFQLMGLQPTGNHLVGFSDPGAGLHREDVVDTQVNRTH